MIGCGRLAMQSGPPPPLPWSRGRLCRPGAAVPAPASSLCSNFPHPGNSAAAPQPPQERGTRSGRPDAEPPAGISVRGGKARRRDAASALLRSGGGF